MNPNMMGMGMQMGNLPNVPTTKELWENEKNKYRHWIILFGISIILIFSLYLVSVILHAINKSSIETSIKNWLDNNTIINNIDKTKDPVRFDAEVTRIVDSFWKQKIIWGSFDLTLSTTALVLFAQTTYQSYQRKSFSKLSSWASFTVALVAIMGAFELLQMAWQEFPRIVFHYNEGIYAFMLYIIPIAIWLFISRPISKIKRVFMISERVEMIKNSPEYQNFTQQMNQYQSGNIDPKNMGPFGPTTQTNNTKTNNTNASSDAKTDDKKVEPILTPKQKRRKELEEMTISDLKEIAKQLSLSGYSSMNKKELIENIMRISEDE